MFNISNNNYNIIQNMNINYNTINAKYNYPKMKTKTINRLIKNNANRKIL